MLLKTHPRIALVGNPNCGKTTLFNRLTGRHLRTGNFPGITAGKQTGECPLSEYVTAKLMDLPGIYSLYPRSEDEEMVTQILTNPADADHPDQVIVVADGMHLHRSLLLFSQVRDLGYPAVLVLNMMDEANRQGLEVDTEALRKKLDVHVVQVNPLTGEGLEKLKDILGNPLFRKCEPLYDVTPLAPEVICCIQEKYAGCSAYQGYQVARQCCREAAWCCEEDKRLVGKAINGKGFDLPGLQTQDTIGRFEVIKQLLQDVVVQKERTSSLKITDKLDQVLTHRTWGYVIFATVLFVIFQCIFMLAQWPVALIESGMAAFGNYLGRQLPSGGLAEGLADGFIPAIGAMLSFIPPLLLLFLFLTLLEESGYMARAAFLMDKMMRRFGLNGKSVMPMVSGLSCAVPSLFLSRKNGTWKDRLLHRLVFPLFSCSSRLPVYVLLVSVAVPAGTVGGFLQWQAVMLFVVFALGFLASLGTAWLLNKYLCRQEQKSDFMMDMPDYHLPDWKHMALSVWGRCRAFTLEAGRVILIVFLIFWALGVGFW